MRVQSFWIQVKIRNVLCFSFFCVFALYAISEFENYFYHLCWAALHVIVCAHLSANFKFDRENRIIPIRKWREEKDVSVVSWCNVTGYYYWLMVLHRNLSGSQQSQWVVSVVLCLDPISFQFWRDFGWFFSLPTLRKW